MSARVCARIAGPLVLFFALLSVCQAQELLRPFQFVSYYLDGLIMLNKIDVANSFDPTTKGYEQVGACVHRSAAFQLELDSQGANLERMRVEGPVEALPATFASFYRIEAVLYGEMGDTCAQALSNGSDYGRQYARLQKVTAQLQSADVAMFKLSVSVPILLTFSKPGNEHRLNITQRERKLLIDKIKQEFGAKMDLNKFKSKERVNYPKGAAAVLLTVLREPKWISSDDLASR